MIGNQGRNAVVVSLLSVVVSATSTASCSSPQPADDHSPNASVEATRTVVIRVGKMMKSKSGAT